MSADVAALAAERDRLRDELHRERVARAFDRSAFVRERLGIPPDMAASRFGEHFRIEDGRIVGEINGAAILDPTNGAVADFDAAIAAIVAAYPHRDAILRPARGVGGSGDGGRSVRGSISRAAFDALSDADRRAHLKDGGRLHDHPGTGTGGGGQPPRGSVSRAAFDAMPAADRTAHVRGGGRVHD